MVSREILNHFKNNSENLKKIKELINNLPNNINSNHIQHFAINPNDYVRSGTISIVMTTYNRPLQTYFTLKTIANSVYKNVHVVIVDDSTTGFLDVNKLKEYNMYIDYIIIKNKFWINPCVNYNIGFKFSRGAKIIIQNGEVCHIYDVINYVNDILDDSAYMVFDVLALKDQNSNNVLYNMQFPLIDNKNNITKLKQTDFGDGWYQHHSIRNTNYHFLTAITINNFNKLEGGFSLDYSMATSYDDDDFVLKIKANGIPIKNIGNEGYLVCGIHQWHPSHIANNWLINKQIFEFKIQHYNSTGTYLKMEQIC